MIVRVWRAQATREGAERYREFFERNRLPALQQIAGFRKAYLLTRAHEDTHGGGRVDVEVLTFWESLDAVRAFAKPNLDAAVVEPEVEAMLTCYDRMVSFFDAQEYGVHPV